MRAVGYVDPERLPQNQADGAPTPTPPISWSAVIQPAAGSWGIARTGAEDQTAPGPLPDHPAERIIRFCADNGHNLVAIVGIPGGADALRAQLDLPPAAEDSPNGAEEDSDDDPSAQRQFGELLTYLTPPAGHPALVLIHDAAHLARNLETLVSRLIQIRRTGSDTLCTDPETPDPLLSGISTLPLTRDDAAPDSPDTNATANPDSTDAPASSRADTDAAAIPKVIALASSGKVLGRTPYGYRSNDDGAMVPVPHEADVVRRVFAWYIGDDATTRPIGMRAIVQRLENEQVPTRSGRPWSTAAVSLMLKNRAYVGTYARYRFMVPGNHEPLIDRPTFERAQRSMQARRNAGTRNEVARTFRLSGMLRCAQCEHALPGMTRKRTWRRSDDSQASKTYRYYEYSDCPQRRGARRRSPRPNSNRRSSAAAATPAPADCPSWRAEDLEKRVAEHLVAMPDDERHAIVPARATSDAPERHHAAVKRFATAIERVAAGRGDLETLTPNLDELAETRQRLREHSAARRSSPATAARNRRIVDDHIADVAADIDIETTRNALRAIVDHIAVSPTDVHVVTRAH